MHFNLLHILIIIYPVIIFLNLLHIHQFVDKQKTLLSKDNKVFLASQERFELPTRQLPTIYKRFFHRLLNVHLCGQLTVFVN